MILQISLQLCIEIYPILTKSSMGNSPRFFNEDAAEAVASSQGTFYYDPSNTHFDEAQMYYSVEKTYAYFTDLEFAGSRPWERNGKMTATVHTGTNYDNAYYSLSTGRYTLVTAAILPILQD